MKQEYELLKEVEKPGSDIEYYVENLCTILENKKAEIMGLKKNLDDFKQRLMEEQVLSLHCSERQQFDSETGDGEFGEGEYDDMPPIDPINKENSNDMFKPGFSTT